MNADRFADHETTAALSIELVARHRRVVALARPLDVNDKIEIGGVFMDLEREVTRVREHAHAVAERDDANTFAVLFADLAARKPWMRIENSL